MLPIKCSFCLFYFVLSLLLDLGFRLLSFVMPQTSVNVGVKLYFLSLSCFYSRFDPLGLYLLQHTVLTYADTSSIKLSNGLHVLLFHLELWTVGHLWSWPLHHPQSPVSWESNRDLRTSYGKRIHSSRFCSSVVLIKLKLEWYSLCYLLPCVHTNKYGTFLVVDLIGSKATKWKQDIFFGTRDPFSPLSSALPSEPSHLCLWNRFNTSQLFDCSVKDSI